MTKESTSPAGLASLTCTKGGVRAARDGWKGGHRLLVNKGGRGWKVLDSVLCKVGLG